MALPEPVPSVLFVCTANVCRSPMAAAILTDRAHGHGLTLRVHSAGIDATGGPADELAQQVLGAQGITLARHASTLLTTDAISDATLVLVMERMHVREIVAATPSAFAKTFGLTEIVALGERRGARRVDEPIDAWRARLQDGRHPTDVLLAGTDFDIADPHGGTRAAYERCAGQLTQLIDALVLLLGGREPGSAPDD